MKTFGGDVGTGLQTNTYSNLLFVFNNFTETNIFDIGG